MFTSDGPLSSEHTVDILIRDANLTPVAYVAADERAALAGSPAGTTEQPITLNGMQGVLLFYQSGGLVAAQVYSSDHPDSLRAGPPGAGIRHPVSGILGADAR
jgi:hypothetical protein